MSHAIPAGHWRGRSAENVLEHPEQSEEERGFRMSEHDQRGFASMDERRRRQIASEGGKASHRRGKAHEFSTEEARQAGRKGGQVAHQRGKAHTFSSEEARMAGRKGGVEVSKNRQHMSAIGRKGGMGAHTTPEPLTERARHDGYDGYTPEADERRLADARS
jgi:general stress protein YciG